MQLDFAKFVFLRFGNSLFFFFFLKGYVWNKTMEASFLLLENLPLQQMKIIKHN